MFFNQPLAAKSANGSLWCGEIREKARAFLFQTNESSVALSLSLSVSISPPFLAPPAHSHMQHRLLLHSPLAAAPSSLHPLSRCLVLICSMRRLRLSTAKCDGARPWRRTGDSLQKRRIQLRDVAGRNMMIKKGGEKRKGEGPEHSKKNKLVLEPRSNKHELEKPV